MMQQPLLSFADLPPYVAPELNLDAEIADEPDYMRNQPEIFTKEAWIKSCLTNWVSEFHRLRTHPHSTPRVLSWTSNENRDRLSNHIKKEIARWHAGPLTDTQTKLLEQLGFVRCTDCRGNGMKCRADSVCGWCTRYDRICRDNIVSINQVCHGQIACVICRDTPELHAANQFCYWPRIRTVCCGAECHKECYMEGLDAGKPSETAAKCSLCTQMILRPAAPPRVQKKRKTDAAQIE